MPDIKLGDISTDIGSTFSNINFSYPEVNIDENIKSGYLELFGNSSYLHFNYDSIKIDTDNKMICVIHKSLDNTKTAYIVFNYEYPSGADKLYNKPYIHLNHHIANEILEGSTLKYDNTGFYILGNAVEKSYLIYFKDTTLKLNTDNIPDTIIGTIKVPSPTNISSAGTKLFKRGIFKNDEIDCGASTIGSETIAKNKYATTVSGNLGISIGVGILIIVGFIATITYNKDILKFADTQKLFNITTVANGLGGGNDNSNKLLGYNWCWAILLLLSIICFLAYGGEMLNDKKSGRDSTVSGLLATAIISLILFIFMIGYKGLVLTPAAPAR
jgi:hypothetical protein